MASSQQTASAAIEQFYACINRQDADGCAEFLAEDCVYEDLHIFPEPMRSRQDVLRFLNKFFQTPELQFVIDGITQSDDSSSVGLMWHMECRRKFFPGSKGCSFYRLENRNGKLQVVYGRDIMEPPNKQGEGALDAMKGVVNKF